jgi:hypothetical protein
MASACQRERLRLLSAQAPDDSTAAFLGNLVVSTHTRFQVPDPSVLWSVPAGGLLGSDGHAATPSAATLGCVQGALKRWVAIAISTLLSLACEPPLTRPPWPATSARPSFSGGSRRSPVLVGLVTPVGCPAGQRWQWLQPRIPAASGKARVTVFQHSDSASAHQ